MTHNTAEASRSTAQIPHVWNPVAAPNPVLARMDAAEDFPHNTCSASRIAAGVAEALITRRPYPLLTEDQGYCGEMIAATVTALWELRKEIARMKGVMPVAERSRIP